MASAFFKVETSVSRGGEARLVPPKAIEGLNYEFVVVQDGGKEAIIKIQESQTVLQKVDRDDKCDKLTPREMAAVRESYPPPRLKQQYRPKAYTSESGSEVLAEPYELDAAGKPVVDTYQTVRSGFHLFDVPISPESAQT